MAAESALLARRPAESASAKDVHMQMGHRLARKLLAINDQAITIRQSQLLGKPGGDEVQVPKEFTVRFGYVGVRGDNLLGDEQHMCRRLRIDIPKSQACSSSNTIAAGIWRSMIFWNKLSFSIGGSSSSEEFGVF